MDRTGFEPVIFALRMIDWNAFNEWIDKQYAPKTAISMKIYARRYSYVLNNPTKASDLSALTPSLKNHAIRSLTALSKFLGCYEGWKAIMHGAGVKWESQSNESLIMDLISSNKIEEAFLWLKDVESSLPTHYYKALKFMLYTGLRPDEACKSITLLNRNDEYLDKAYMILQHFKYPKLFIRRIKKAYISFATEEMIKDAKEIGEINYNSILRACNRRGLPCKASLLRKAWATKMRKAGIEPEIIDLLQGRMQASIFVKHYYRPDLLGEIRGKVLEGLETLP